MDQTSFTAHRHETVCVCLQLWTKNSDLSSCIYIGIYSSFNLGILKYTWLMIQWYSEMDWRDYSKAQKTRLNLIRKAAFGRIYWKPCDWKRLKWPIWGCFFNLNGSFLNTKACVHKVFGWFVFYPKHSSLWIISGTLYWRWY